MARIRTIKPEFWKSQAIAAHDFFTRLVFIGLWTYVDDNGVGIDHFRLIAAELFPLEEDFASVARDVRESLAKLADAGRIQRYTVHEKQYLAIVNWTEHQKIDRPNKPRYPSPDSAFASPTPPTSPNTPPRETLDEPSRDSRATPPSGTEEQRNRGTEEQRNNGAPLALRTAGAPLALVPRTDDAQTLIGEWLDHCRKRPPGTVIGQVGKQIKAMLAEGIDPTDIRAGLVAWWRKGMHPSTLPSVVNELMNAQPAARAAPRATHDQRVEDGLALSHRLAAEEAM